MAGDWIKMRTDLYRDPKVCLIADELLDEDSPIARYVNQNLQCDMAVTRNVMRNVTVGALVSVWGVFRHRGKRVGNDLVVKGCAISVIDDVSDLPGFGAAMESVGWLSEDGDYLVLPRFFEEFNVDPADEAKAKNAERQRKFREKHKEESQKESNVTVTLKSNAREEKRREEVNTSRFADFWNAFPVKKGKAAAEKAFAKAKINGEFDSVLQALQTQIANCADLKFFPHPATWLNGKRWEDEIHPVTPTLGAFV